MKTRISTGSTHRNLVVLRAGASSLHTAWFTPDREFDIVVDAWGEHPEQYEGTCDVLFEGLDRSGSLAQHRLFTEHPELLEDYDAIWIPDDDIETSTPVINTLFRLHREAGFALAQPALTTDSYFSHSITVQHSGCSLREVTMVESLVPIFTSSALRACLPTFVRTESGIGADNVWPAILGGLGGRLAVYDCLAVRHTRPVSAGLASEEAAEHARAEIQDLLDAYSVQQEPHRVLRAWDAEFVPVPEEVLPVFLVHGFPRTSVQGHRRWDSYAVALDRHREQVERLLAAAR